MRALVYHHFGEPSEVLAVEELPTPQPGAGEVLVRTLLSPIHNHDIWTIRGDYGIKPELPARAGTEAVGVVEALGDGVTHLSVGQRVATGGTFGVWAEYFVAQAAGLLPVPDGIPDEVAAQLVSMPFSAISLLDALDLSEGAWIAQNAANGAVGRLVAQLAAARGINVVGLVRRRAGVDELKSQGIERIVATDAADWREQVAAITGGAAISVGVDSVGGAASGDLVSLLAMDGSLVVFGAMQSPVMEIPSSDVIFRGISVTGFWGSRVSGAMDPERRRALITEVVTRTAQGALTLPVAAVHAFDDARAATTAAGEAGRAGKVLLRP